MFNETSKDGILEKALSLLNFVGGNASFLPSECIEVLFLLMQIYVGLIGQIMQAHKIN